VICGNCFGIGIGWVQMRTRIMNQLQAVAMNEGYRWKKKLFGQQGRALLEKLSLAPWASRRRKELLELLDRWIQRSRS
jgi:transposase